MNDNEYTAHCEIERQQKPLEFRNPRRSIERALDGKRLNGARKWHQEQVRDDRRRQQQRHEIYSSRCIEENPGGIDGRNCQHYLTHDQMSPSLEVDW